MSVICFNPLPSMFINQISTAPERLEAKAICAAPPIGVGCNVMVIVGEGIGVRVRVGVWAIGITVAGEFVGTGVWDMRPMIGS
jgi:hypothetical protein